MVAAALDDGARGYLDSLADPARWIVAELGAGPSGDDKNEEEQLEMQGRSTGLRSS
jgi:hypothetical protein